MAGHVSSALFRPNGVIIVSCVTNALSVVHSGFCDNLTSGKEFGVPSEMSRREIHRWNILELPRIGVVGFPLVSSCVYIKKAGWVDQKAGRNWISSICMPGESRTAALFQGTRQPNYW